VYLSDFGLTKRLDASASEVLGKLCEAEFGALETPPLLTLAGYFVRTPAYAAPSRSAWGP
jgi:hypothetical protein